jgi:hypothetical protein
MSERELGRYQMLWDCPSCDTPKLLGLEHRHCPSCGAAQDPTRRYYPSAADQIAVADHRYTGADKICPACESPAAAIAHNCANCGSALDGARGVTQRAAQQASGSAYETDDAKRARAELEAKRRGAQAPSPPPASGRGKFVVLAVILALVVGAVVFFTWKKEVGLEVASHSWTREIEIETQSLVTETAWRDGVPAGAQSLSCSRAERSTRKVPDGERCSKERRDLGDGTFKEVEVCTPKFRSEPVYDDRCTYVIPRWVRARMATATGASVRDEPRWPEVRLARTGSCIGCEREGSRSERYTVELVEHPGERRHSCEFAQARWAGLTVGSTWHAKARMIGGGLDCDTLSP